MDTRSLADLAADYIQNAERIENRIEELQEQLKRVRSQTVRYKLGKRINMLRRMADESKQIAYELQHYYEK